MAEQITEEQYLIERIEEIQEQYRKAAQPYIERLVRIRSMQPSPPMIFDLGSISKDVLEQINKEK